MSELIHLPVPLYLPYHGAIVATVVALTVAARFYFQRATPGGKTRPTLDQLSAYDLAFLASGAAGVIKTAVFALDVKGFLARASKDEITVRDVQATAPPAAEPQGAAPYRPLHSPAQLNLDPVESHVFYHLRGLSRAPSSKEILGDAALKTRLQPVLDGIQQRLADAGLTNAAARISMRLIQAIAVLLLAVSTGYKCWVSSPYASFFWLVAISVAGLAVVALAGRGLGLSRWGKEILEEARQAQKVAVSEGAKVDINDPASAPDMARYSHGLVLGMAVVGVAAMAGTDYAYYSDVFKANQAGSTGCGGCSSCSSCGGCGG